MLIIILCIYNRINLFEQKRNETKQNNNNNENIPEQALALVERHVEKSF